MNRFKELFYGSRKFIIMCGVLLVGLSFRIAGLLDGKELVSLYNTVGVAFMGSNAVEHVVDALKQGALDIFKKKE